jgi:hypothetical protein
MATGETGIDDVSYDLISVQYHSLKAGHDYGQYVRDAENARISVRAARAWASPDATSLSARTRPATAPPQGAP